MGPWLVLKDQVKDPLNLNYKAWINNEIKQKGNTRAYKWSPAEVVSAASQYYPVEIGFMYLMGALPGVTSVLPKAGDTTKSEIEGLGILENSVIAEK
jgi:5-oxopent-3-ene-1,2,5-tricarboxylate decarboxylase/2-hydroxyhepta-2,4-diene-1,7-dioate isomerase